MENIEGDSEGMVCNREGCTGIIAVRNDGDGCSCHVNPPCSYCTSSRFYCPECRWEEEQAAPPQISATTAAYYEREHKERREYMDAFEKRYRGEVPAEKLQIISEMHTHFSMIKRGVFPKGTMTSSEILDHVRGTFGGRFDELTDYSFKYISYTD